MEQERKVSLKEPDVLFLSCFGIGFFPKAPGTVATFAMLPILYFLKQFNAPFFFYLPLLIITTTIGSFFAERAQRRYDVHDPSWIVLDEALGISLAWLFLQSEDFFHLFILAILFRFFDIIKFWPASYFDKEVKHGAGTILDDLVSGIYAGVCYLIFYFTFF